MIINKVLKTFLFALGLLFVVLQIAELAVYADLVYALIMIALVALVYNEKVCKCICFKMFLILNALAAIINYSSWNLLPYFDESTLEIVDIRIYFVVNGLNILAYLFLIFQIFSSMNVKEVMSRFFIHIFILLVLDIFCIFIVSDTTERAMDDSQYILEFIYNAVIMALLSIALINYMYRDDKKSMNMLVGSIFIVFSEILLLAYFYIAQYNEINVISSIFFILAFIFFYIQARLEHEEHIDLLEIEERKQEQLEV